MKFYKLSILLFLILAACQTENTQVEYNNAEAVYLKLEKTFVLHPDGTTELTVEKEQKLLTHRSFHSLYGQTDIYFNPLTDSVVVEIAETKTPNGEIVPVPEMIAVGGAVTVMIWLTVLVQPVADVAV